MMVFNKLKGFFKQHPHYKENCGRASVFLVEFGKKRQHSSLGKIICMSVELSIRVDWLIMGI